jgi:hypothetical protein
MHGLGFSKAHLRSLGFRLGFLILGVLDGSRKCNLDIVHPTAWCLFYGKRVCGWTCFFLWDYKISLLLVFDDINGKEERACVGTYREDGVLSQWLEQAYTFGNRPIGGRGREGREGVKCWNMARTRGLFSQRQVGAGGVVGRI